MLGSQDTFTVLLGNQSISVSKRITECSQYLHNMLSLGLDQEEIEIDPTIVGRQTFEEFVKFCEMNEYAEPDVAVPIRTNNLAEVIDEKNYNFIKEYPIEGDKIHNLLNASTFFVCKGLQKVLAAVFACKIYFQDKKQALVNKRKELGIEKQITYEDEEKYRNNYFFDQTK